MISLIIDHLDKAERKLEAWSLSREKYERIFYDSPAAMALVEIGGHFADVNAAACRMFAAEPEKIIGTTWQSWTHPDDIQRDAEQVGRLVSGDLDVARMVKRYKRGTTDQYFPAYLSYSLVKDMDSKPILFVSQIIDLTLAEQWLVQARALDGTKH